MALVPLLAGPIMEVHHAAVFDENVDARTSVKPAGGGPARVFGTPASCLPLPHQPAEGATARRALGDISNRAGLAAGGPHGAAPKAGGATPCAPGAATAHPPAKPHPSSVCAGLPISERTASFITDEVVALATVYAADGVEALAGHSGREQLAHALRDAQEQARQCASSLAAGGEGQGSFACDAPPLDMHDFDSCPPGDLGAPDMSGA